MTANSINFFFNNVNLYYLLRPIKVIIWLFLCERFKQIGMLKNIIPIKKKFNTSSEQCAGYISSDITLMIRMKNYKYTLENIANL